MRLTSDSKLVLWLLSCALAGAFLQSILEPFDLARLRDRSGRSIVKARQVRARRAKEALAY